ncbi:GNAT family N-acetyltransferase [Candidatus Micrarchaeota archaeon]|nr:GNAT family N-acetyltransferase [Candidatus Micrarchaeota archaeon]
MPEQGRMPRLGKTRAGIQQFEEGRQFKTGGKYNIANIKMHPDILSRESERWGKLTGTQRKGLIQNLHPEIKFQRNLLSQAFRQWRKQFPSEERQEFSAWLDSFSQNRKGSGKADYHFVAAYKGPKSNPQLVGYSTMHASRPSQGLPVPLALAEYGAVLPESRKAGVYKALLQKRIELARKSGSKYLVAEIDKYGNRENGRWQQLKNTTNPSQSEKEELAGLNEKRTRVGLMTKLGYRRIDLPANAPYLDPSEHVSFPGEGQGKLNRDGKLNPLDLYMINLTKKPIDKLNQKQVSNVLYSMYSGPQDVQRMDVKYIMDKFFKGKIPQEVRFHDPRDLLRPFRKR